MDPYDVDEPVSSSPVRDATDYGDSDDGVDASFTNDDASSPADGQQDEITVGSGSDLPDEDGDGEDDEGEDNPWAGSVEEGAPHWPRGLDEPGFDDIDPIAHGAEFANGWDYNNDSDDSGISDDDLAGNNGPGFFDNFPNSPSVSSEGSTPDGQDWRRDPPPDRVSEPRALHPESEPEPEPEEPRYFEIESEPEFMPEEMDDENRSAGGWDAVSLSDDPESSADHNGGTPHSSIHISDDHSSNVDDDDLIFLGDIEHPPVNRRNEAPFMPLERLLNRLQSAEGSAEPERGGDLFVANSPRDAHFPFPRLSPHRQGLSFHGNIRRGSGGFSPFGTIRSGNHSNNASLARRSPADFLPQVPPNLRVPLPPLTRAGPFSMDDGEGDRLHDPWDDAPDVPAIRRPVRTEAPGRNLAGRNSSAVIDLTNSDDDGEEGGEERQLLRARDSSRRLTSQRSRLYNSRYPSRHHSLARSEGSGGGPRRRFSFIDLTGEDDDTPAQVSRNSRRLPMHRQLPPLVPPHSHHQRAQQNHQHQNNHNNPANPIHLQPNQQHPNFVDLVIDGDPVGQHNGAFLDIFRNIERQRVYGRILDRLTRGFRDSFPEDDVQIIGHANGNHLRMDNPNANPLAGNAPNLNYGGNGYNNPRANEKPPYVPPPPAAPGFTRDLNEEEVIICPSCDEELAYVPDEPEGPPVSKRARTKKDTREQPFWAVKECGHVFCRKCYDTRTNTDRTGFRPVHNPPHRKQVLCAVEDCTSNVTNKSSWVGLFV